MRLPFVLHRSLHATFVVAPHEPSLGAMWRTQNGRAVVRALVLATLWLAVAGRPLVRRSLALSDEEPLILYGWGKSTRLQHLYAAGPHISNCFLNIRSDGSVDCEDEQNERSEWLPARSLGSLAPPGVRGRANLALTNPLDSQTGSEEGRNSVVPTCCLVPAAASSFSCLQVC